MIPAGTRQRWADLGIPRRDRVLMRVAFFALMAPCVAWVLFVVVLWWAWLGVSGACRRGKAGPNRITAATQGATRTALWPRPHE